MASIKNVRRSWSYIWDKLVTWLAPSAGTLPNPLLGQRLVIDEALTLYVETSGDDANDGTYFAPFKTVQAALDWLRPYVIQAPVTIQVGIGTFDGYNIPALTIERGGRVGGTDLTAGSVTISGTLVASITGLVGITESGAVTDASKTWTVNEHVGKMLGIDNSASVYPIQSNTATRIVACSGASSPAGRTYTIYDFGTVIHSNVSISASSNLTGGIVFEPGAGARMVPVALQGSILVTHQKITHTPTLGYTCAHVGSGTTAAFTECYFDVTNNSYGIYVYGGSKASVSRSVFYIAKTTGYGITGVGVGAEVVSAGQCLFLGTGAAGQYGIGSTGALLVYNTGSTVFQNLGYGVYIGLPTHSYLMGTFLQCQTGIYVRGGEALVVDSKSSLPNWPHTSAGNTTFIRAVYGAKVSVSSDIPSGLATTDINLDGGTTTGSLASMRALSPKALAPTPNPYGTVVYES